MSRPRPGGPPSSGQSGVHGTAQGTYALGSSRIDVQVRDGYLHIVARGTIANLDEVGEYTALMERVMAEQSCRRVLLDARGEQGDPQPVVRAAVWEWFRSDRSFDTVAYVVGDDEAMKAARINMTALSLGMNLRAFVSVVEAHRFLTSPQRKPSSVFSAPPRESIAPPPTADARPSSFPPKLEGDRRTPPDFKVDRKATSPGMEAPRIPSMSGSMSSGRKPTLTGLISPLLPIAPAPAPVTPVPPSDSESSGERPIYRDESAGVKSMNPRSDRGN